MILPLAVGSIVDGFCDCLEDRHDNYKLRGVVRPFAAVNRVNN